MCPTLAHCETMKCRSESRRELVMANVLLPAAFYCQNVASRFYSSGFSDSQPEKNNVASAVVQHNRVFLRKICKKSLFVMFLVFPARKWGILVQLELQTNWLLSQKKMLSWYFPCKRDSWENIYCLQFAVWFDLCKACYEEWHPPEYIAMYSGGCHSS